MKAYLVLHGSATLLTGLLAGLFYGYSCSVNKGLGNLPDEQYLRAFQSINQVILNTVFFLSFAGSFIVLLLSAIVSYLSGQTSLFGYSLAAWLIYVIAVAGVTIAGNVPLNEQLAQFDLSSASPTAVSAMRKTFELPWNNFHAIRTVASVLSFGCLVAGLIHSSTK